MKWATCDGTPCKCYVLVGDNDKQFLNCTKCKWTTFAAIKAAPSASRSSPLCVLFASFLISPSSLFLFLLISVIPKCFLMKAEMYRAKKGMDTRSGGKPVESAFVDNDGIYDPVCENDGRFKAKQCNNTEECWCVNSAGVRRTDKGDKADIKCEKLVET